MCCKHPVISDIYFKNTSPVIWYKSATLIRPNIYLKTMVGFKVFKNVSIIDLSRRVFHIGNTVFNLSIAATPKHLSNLLC